MKLAILPAVALLAVCSIAAKPAFAGFIALSTNETPSNAGLTISGTFTSYTPDTANDPQIQNDLSSYHYVLNLATPISSSANGAADTGTYEIFYQNAGVPTPIQVSAGTLGGSGNLASFNGSIVQTPVTGGPANPAFDDFSVVYGTNSTALGLTITAGKLELLQLAPALNGSNPPAPEPASLGILAVAAAGLGLRRRRSV